VTAEARVAETNGAVRIREGGPAADSCLLGGRTVRHTKAGACPLTPETKPAQYL